MGLWAEKKFTSFCFHSAGGVSSMILPWSWRIILKNSVFFRMACWMWGSIESSIAAEGGGWSHAAHSIITLSSEANDDSSLLISSSQGPIESVLLICYPIIQSGESGFLPFHMLCPHQMTITPYQFYSMEGLNSAALTGGNSWKACRAGIW